MQAGAIFVNQTALVYFDGLFQSVGYSTGDVQAYSQEAVESFEAEGKKGFEGADNGDVGIKVGNRKLTEKELNIRRGLMSIPGCVALVLLLIDSTD